ncbi:MAG: hypothetical protein IKU44_05535, partial [Firmicutes bacterium]|nr:hypothetical protein [Bacillota bacterium]
MKHKIITLAIAFIMVCTVAVVGTMAPAYADTATTEETTCTHEKFHQQSLKIIKPTCTEYGKLKGYCNSCFTPIEKADPDSPPLGHDFTVKSLKDQYKKSDATCKSLEEYYFCCARSGCTAHGEESFTIGTYASHKYNIVVDCVKRQCEVCGKVVGITGKSHTWEAANCTTPKTCKVCGAKEGDVKHSWIGATCTAPKTCEVCKLTDETDPAKGHNWKKISCTKHECIRCHTVELMDEPEHNWKAGDCKTKTTCTICKETTGELLPHTIEIIPAVPATCMTVGLTEGQKCSVCKEYLVEQKVKATTPHTFWRTSIMMATPQADGKESKLCKDCYYPYEEVKIPKIDKVKMTESFVYTGAAKKPKVTVYDSKGKAISSQNYKVTYKNNKSIGTGTATITFSGRYYGKIVKEFQ